MTTAKKAPAKKSPAKKAAKKKPSSAQHCWPGFEPTPGKSAGEKGSCQPKPGKQKKSVRKADQKAAAASKLQKAGKPNPH
jgi:hypothetical protein